MFFNKYKIISSIFLISLVAFLGGCSEDTTGNGDDLDVFGSWINEIDSVSSISLVLKESSILLIDGEDTLANSSYEQVSDEETGIEYILTTTYEADGITVEALKGYSGGYALEIVGDSLKIDLLTLGTQWYERASKDDYQWEIKQVMLSEVDVGDDKNIIFDNDSTGSYSRTEMVFGKGISSYEEVKLLSDSLIEIGSGRFPCKRFDITWLVVNEEEEDVFAETRTIMLGKE